MKNPGHFRVQINSQGDFDAVVTTRRWNRRGSLCHRCIGVRSNLQCNKLWTPFSGQMTRPEIPAPPRQQRPRNLVTPRRRRTLTITTKTFLDDPHLLSIRPVPPTTLVDNRKNLNLRSELRGCHKVRFLTNSADRVRRPPPEGYEARRALEQSDSTAPAALAQPETDDYQQARLSL